MSRNPVLQHLGSPLVDVLVLGGAVAPGPSGAPVPWAGAVGSPASLVAVDPGTGEVLVRHRMPGTAGAWAVAAAPDGSVLAGTYAAAAVFRATADGIVDLGPPPAGETAIWALTAGPDSVVYGGTSPNATLFAKDPSTGATRGYGRVSDRHSYVRGVAWHDGEVYAGTNPPAAVIAVGTGSGQRRSLPAPAGVDVRTAWAHDVHVRGRHLFVRFGTTNRGTLAVWDLTARRWVATVPAARGLEPSPPDEAGRVYLVAGERLLRFDPATERVDDVGVPVPAAAGSPRAVGWATVDDDRFPGRSLVALLVRGGVVRYNPGTGAHDVVQSEVPGSPVPVNAIAEGPDGRVYVGGFLSGGLAAVDAGTGRRLEHHDFPQVEGLTRHDRSLLIGTYPGAGVYVYDPAAPWTADTPTDPAAPRNPRRITGFADQQQTRATALVSADRHVGVGTEPELDAFGGVLALLDPATDAVVHAVRAPVPDLSIVALAHRSGVLFAATSIYGGQATTPPRAPEAVVFAWSVSERRVLWRTAPVPGAPTLSDVEPDTDGRLWVASGGHLLALAAGTGAVLARRQVSTSGASAGLAFNRVDGRLYVAGARQGVSWVDPRGPGTGRVSDAPGLHVIAHSSGAVFFSAGSTLFRYGTRPRRTPAPRDTASACPAGGIGDPGFADVDAPSPSGRAIACVWHWGVARGTSARTFSPSQPVTRAQMASFLARALRRTGLPVPPGPDAFPDDTGSAHAADIDALAAAGIVEGDADGRLRPNRPLTRAEAAALLTRAAVLRLLRGRRPVPTADADYFRDDAGHPLESAIDLAALLGLTGGYDDGTYRPGATVRRDHVALFLARWLDLAVEEGLAVVPPAPLDAVPGSARPGA